MEARETEYFQGEHIDEETRIEMLVTLEELERARSQGDATEVLRILADRQLEYIDNPLEFCPGVELTQPERLMEALGIGTKRRFASTDECRAFLRLRFPTTAELHVRANEDANDV
jgi:hypothetical protein